MNKAYMKNTKNIENISIVFARRQPEHWKVAVNYSTKDEPYITSMLLINLKTKLVDFFQEDVTSY